MVARIQVTRPADPPPADLARAKVAAVYDAIALVQADAEALGEFTRAGQGELNRVANRAQRVLDRLDADAEVAA